jgi:hypothetical protein
MGLAQRIKEYVREGGDPNDIIKVADKHGSMSANHPTGMQSVKWNSRDKRYMRRHPRDFSEDDLREAGVWDEVKDEWTEEEEYEEEAETTRD